jgi:hypothetical protein
MESQSKLSFKKSKKPTLSQQVDLFCGTSAINGSGEYINCDSKQKGPVLLQGLEWVVGRTRFELVTNGLKGQEEILTNQGSSSKYLPQKSQNGEPANREKPSAPTGLRNN